MSTPNPTHIDVMAEELSKYVAGNPHLKSWAVMVVKHVVSKLTDAGYSIVANATVEFGLATSEDPFIREDINEQAAYRIAARYPDVNVMTRTRGPWRPAAAAEGEKP